MDVEFETPTMMNILLAQGDHEGAQSILQRLRQKQAPQDGFEEVLSFLEKWLDALRKDGDHGLR